MLRSVLVILIMAAIVAVWAFAPVTHWERWQAVLDRKDYPAMQQKSESLHAGMTEGAVVYTLGPPRSVDPDRYVRQMAGTKFWVYEGPENGAILIVGFDQGRVTEVNFLVAEDKCGPFYWHSATEYWTRLVKKRLPPELAIR